MAAEPYLDRRSYLGGSDISAIIGVDPYASPLTVYNRKLGLDEKEPPSFAMLRGIELEPGICSLYSRTQEVFLGPAGVTPPHPFYDFLKGNYDRVILDKKGGKPVALLEAKTASMRQAAKWGDPDQEVKKVPTNYYVQANYYCGLLGLDTFRIVALLMWRDELSVYEFPFDEATFDGCAEEGARFWIDHVVAQVPPEPEMHRTTQEDIVKLWPDSTGEVVTATQELEDLWKQAFDAYKTKREAEEFLNTFKTSVQFFAKEASVVEFTEGAVKVIDKRGNPKYKDIAVEFAKMAGVPLESDEWKAMVANFTGKSTRYVRLPWSGDQE